MNEKYEWIHSWVDHADSHDLPRILLIGDSITYGYQEQVRKKFCDIAYVDYLSTSYAVDLRIYGKLVELFAGDKNYDIIHFNHGLHGIHLSKTNYKNKLNKLLKKIKNKGKILLANCTVVYQEGNRELHPQWNRRILERNAAISEIAGENNFPVDDLYQVSLKIPKEDRREDGTHYEAAGYEILAEHVYAFVKTILENEDISAGE